MVSKEDIKNIAILSKLYVSDEELQSLTDDMSKILEFADTINNADVDGIDFDNINNLSNVLRSDEVKPSFPQSRILENARDSDEGCFLVKKRA